MNYLNIRRNTNTISISIGDNKLVKPLTTDFFNEREKYIADVKNFFIKYYRDSITTIPIDKVNVDLFLSIINDMYILKGYIEENNRQFHITFVDNNYTILTEERIYCENIYYYLSKYFK